MIPARSFFLTVALFGATLLRQTHSVRLRRSEDEPRSYYQGQHLRRNLQQETTASADVVHPTDHLVLSLPLLDKFPTDMYAGHLKASPDGDKKFFYWLVAPQGRNDAADTPLVIWLNGGPGCSSMDGFFLENGPLQFVQRQGQWVLEANPNSWHLAPAWVLYIDQPVGTGLSFTKSRNYAKNDAEVNQDFAFFLEEFLMLYGDFFLDKDTGTTTRPIFMTGESHAGHYIPSMMDHLLSRQDGRLRIGLGGAAIGNGWFDPYHQYSAAEAAYGAGLIGLTQKARLDELEQECQAELDKGNYAVSVCYQLMESVVDQSLGNDSSVTVSSYDVNRLEPKSARAYPSGHDVVEAYLGGHPMSTNPPLQTTVAEVLDALHATESVEANQRYEECTDPPYLALAHQDGLGVVPELTSLLNHGVRMMFFNGMDDLMCNHVGNERALLELPWKFSSEWALAPRHVWSMESDPTATIYVQEYENLSFLKIPHAGHMVPKDRPELSLDMIRTFIYRRSFKRSKQALERVVPKQVTCRR